MLQLAPQAPFSPPSQGHTESKSRAPTVNPTTKDQLKLRCQYESRWQPLKQPQARQSRGSNALQDNYTSEVHVRTSRPSTCRNFTRHAAEIVTDIWLPAVRFVPPRPSPCSRERGGRGRVTELRSSRPQPFHRGRGDDHMHKLERGLDPSTQPFHMEAQGPSRSTRRRRRNDQNGGIPLRAQGEGGGGGAQRLMAYAIRKSRTHDTNRKF